MGDTIRYPNMGTVKKAAEIYGLSPVYIRRLCKEGKIRYVNAGHEHPAGIFTENYIRIFGQPKQG